MRWSRVDDDLLVGADLVDAVVEVRDPVQRLRRRRDVVAPRRDHDDRRADVPQVDAPAVGGLDRAARQLVADEQLVGDEAHLLLGGEEVAAPPLLEAEIARLLGVHLGVEVVRLGPERVRGVKVLEVRDQVSPVELAVAEVAHERGQPGAAEQAAGVAHRVHALAAGPVGQGRSRDRDDPDVVRGGRGHHHDRPAGLAVADHDRLAVGLGMQLAHLADEQDLGAADVLDRLPGLGLREEGHEVDRMARPHRHADLALLLEAADAGAMPGARVDDHERPLRRIAGLAPPGLDAHERVVHRSLELTTVDHHLVVEDQHGRLAGLVVLDRLVAALSQHVPEQDRALAGIDPVVPGVLGDGGGRPRRLAHLGDGLAPGLRERLRQPLRRCLAEAGEGCGGGARLRRRGDLRAVTVAGAGLGPTHRRSIAARRSVAGHDRSRFMLVARGHCGSSHRGVYGSLALPIADGRVPASGMLPGRFAAAARIT
ncbi:MAG: hypothetical protein K0R41_4706, partial [Geminicoccaceae bacterium]|nr:hypothetical protein [Geminicoccaceae bacterium]